MGTGADYAVQPPKAKEIGTPQTQAEISSTKSGPVVDPEEPGKSEQQGEQTSTESGPAIDSQESGQEDADDNDIGDNGDGNDSDDAGCGDNGDDDNDGGDDGDGWNETNRWSVDTLTLEIEVQELIDRVTTLEKGHSAVLNLLHPPPPQPPLQPLVQSTPLDQVH